jgi:hypothetical protein
MKSNTPETDAEVNELKTATTYNMVWSEFARKLERERDLYKDSLLQIHRLAMDHNDEESTFITILAIASDALTH